MIRPSYSYSSISEKRIINGRPVVDIELKREADEKSEEIVGHYGNQPVHIRRQFAKPVTRKLQGNAKKPKKKAKRGKTARKKNRQA